MQDHEFEKQVHQKMEEINILPSDAVWKEVERRLHPKNKSRRWIWFPFFFIAMGVGGYLIYTNNPASNQSVQPGSDLSLNKSNALKYNKDKTEHSEEVSKTTKYKKQDATEITTLSTANKERYRSGNDKKPATSRQLTLPDPATHSGSHFNKTAKPEVNSLSQNTGINRNTRGKLVNNLPVNLRQLPQIESLSGPSGHKTDDSSGTMIITKEPVPARVDPSTAPSYPVNTSRALQNLRVVNAPVQKQLKKQGWEWGFSVQAGKSGVTNGKFTSLFARETVADVNNSFTTGNLFVNPSAVYIPPSVLKPGPGYSVGVLVKKQLTRRTFLSAGLQYTRFTTSHKVGKRITDSIVNLRNNSADQKSIEDYFRLGNTASYQNKYHFIELPVLIETRLTGYRFVPVYWDLGVSFSRLISSNALHYDGNSKIYYKNNSLFNRNQFSFITGLPVRILKEERFSLKAGPLFEYGVSNLINRARSGNKHLLFIGVRADITLFK